MFNLDLSLSCGGGGGWCCWTKGRGLFGGMRKKKKSEGNK